MARLTILGGNLNVVLTARERRLLGRPNLKLELRRVKAFSLEGNFDQSSLGRRISKRPFLANNVGEYRSEAKRVIILGNAGGGI